MQAVGSRRREVVGSQWCLQTVKGARLVAEGCGKERAIDLLFSNNHPVPLHSCFQAEGYLQSSRTLCGELMRARETGPLSSAREANSLHIESVPSEKV